MYFYAAERLKCGTAGSRSPERSELETLSAVATTALFGVINLLLIGNCVLAVSAPGVRIEEKGGD